MSQLPPPNQALSLIRAAAMDHPRPFLLVRPDEQAPARAPDTAELSAAALRLDRLSQLPVRTELLERIRQQIADGTYETPERIHQAVDRLAEDLFGAA